MGGEDEIGVIGVRAAAAGEPEELGAVGVGSWLLGEVKPADREKRGPGRPPGSKNKSSAELRERWLSKYRDPLDGLGDMISLPIPELARILKCKRLDAAKLWLAAVAQAAPFLHQRQPQAIQFNSDTLGMLIINIGAARDAGADPAEFGIDLKLIEQNQGVSGDAGEQSDDISRTDGAK